MLRPADIQRLGIDPRTAASETAHPELFGVTDGALFDFFEQGMLTANGSVHRRRRSPFSRSFATRTMADLRPHIRRSSEELIESWYADGQIEFVRQFADQLPARVIGDLLGLPRADIPSFTKLVYLVTRFISESVLPDEISESEAAAKQLCDYVEKTLEDRRRAPRDDFLSDFLAKADAAGELSPLEIIFQIVQLIVGGTDTTRVAIVVQLAPRPGNSSSCQPCRAHVTKRPMNVPTCSTSVEPTNRGCSPPLVLAPIVASAKRWRVSNSRRAWRRSRPASRTSNWIKRRRSRGTAESAASMPCGYPGSREPRTKLRSALHRPRRCGDVR